MKFFENNNNVDTKIFALGGLGEVGKNMYCVMRGDEIIIIDAGVIFPESDLLGIDYVIQDYTFLKANESKIKGLFITHGHEDHIGAIPFLVQMVNIPVIYAPNQAAALIRHKFDEHGIKYNNLKVYTDDTKVKFRDIEVEFFRTTHSIPDSHGVCITTPDGIIVETGDFKFDLTPIGPTFDVTKMAEIGSRGVSLLLSDSTNALTPGTGRSESKVDNALSDLFKQINGRIIVATFASNIYRIKHIVDTCKRNNRKIVVFGRSMDNNIEISIQGGYIKNKDIFITANEADKLPDNQVCLLCTGSQGEPLAALSRIANGTHKFVKLRDDDTIIFSSNPIPGNGISVARTINKLYLRGVKVYTNTYLTDLHASGHAQEDELKWMLRIIKPKYFMPMHGEYRMLKKHAEIANECGVPVENTFINGNGDVLSLRKGVITRAGTIPTGAVYIEGNNIEKTNNYVIRDRKTMSTDGIVIVIANINSNNAKLLTNPNVTSRGFIQVNENEDLINYLESVARESITNNLVKPINFENMKETLTASMSDAIYEKTGRHPIILPVIMDIK